MSCLIFHSSTDKAQNLSDDNSRKDRQSPITVTKFWDNSIVMTILLIQYYTPPKPQFSTGIQIICQINIRCK